MKLFDFLQITQMDNTHVKIHKNDEILLIDDWKNYFDEDIKVIKVNSNGKVEIYL